MWDKDIARTTIIRLDDFSNKDEIADIVAYLQIQYKHVFVYKCPMGLIIFDRYIDNDKVNIYYREIMDYQNAVEEDLEMEDIIIRIQEVEQKWLNGNFNYWLLEPI